MKKFISSSATKDFKDAVNLAKELNCGLEISRFPDFWNIDNNFEHSLQMMKQELLDFENEISLHGFFFELCVASGDKRIREISIDRFYQTFRAAKFLKAKTVVFHTGYNAPIKHHLYKKQIEELTIEFFKDFVKLFEENKMVAVLENVQELSPDFIKHIITEVNSPCLRASLDIGHANIHSDCPAEKWVDGYGHYLYHMHLHNNFGTNDDHFSLLNGNINLEAVFEAILRHKLKPKIVFEIFDKKSVIESIRIFDKFFEGKTAESSNLR